MSSHNNRRRAPLPVPPSSNNQRYGGGNNKNSRQVPQQHTAPYNGGSAGGNNQNRHNNDSQYRARSPPTANYSRWDDDRDSRPRSPSYSSSESDRSIGRHQPRNNQKRGGGNNYSNTSRNQQPTTRGAKSYRDRYVSSSDSDRYQYSSSDDDYDNRYRRGYQTQRGGGGGAAGGGNVRKTIGERRHVGGNINNKALPQNAKRARSPLDDHSFSDSASENNHSSRGRRVEGPSAKGNTDLERRPNNGQRARDREGDSRPATIVNGRMQRKNASFSKKQTEFNSELERLKSVLNIDSFEEALGVSGADSGVGRNPSAGPEPSLSLVTKIGGTTKNSSAGVLAKPVTMAVLYLTNVDASVLDCHLKSICSQFGSTVVRTSRARNKENDELLRRLMAPPPAVPAVLPVDNENISSGTATGDLKAAKEGTESIPVPLSTPLSLPKVPSAEEEYFSELQRSLRQYHYRNMHNEGVTTPSQRGDAITIQALTSYEQELLVQFSSNEDMVRALALLNGAVINGRTVYCGILCSKVG